MRERFVVVGDGIAGLSVTRDLAEQGVPVALVVQEDLDNAGVDRVGFDSRDIIPIVPENVVESLGLDGQDDQHVTGIRLLADYKARRASSWIATRQTRRTGRLPVVLDHEVARQRLLEEIRDGTRVKVIPGTVEDVLLDDTRPSVSGLVVSGQEIETSLVIDATGAGDKGVAGIVARKALGYVTSLEEPQSSTFLGAYVELANPRSSSSFPDSSHTMYQGLLSGGIHVALGPHKTSGSTANHALVVSGRPEAIRYGEGVGEVRSEDGETWQDAMRRQRFEALERIVSGTIWQEIIGRTLDFDRTSYYPYTFARQRVPDIGGLILIGDAQMHINPQVGEGYDYIARDIQTLRPLITKKWENPTESVAGMYNRTQKEVCRQRMERARSAMRYLGPDR